MEELIERLRSHFIIKLEKIQGVEENVQFKLPPEISNAQLETASLRNGE